MKIRIRRNSVRLRLTRPEVESLCSNGLVEERTVFPGQEFIYRVQLSDQHQQLYANFDQNTIDIFLPKAKADGWASNNTVGFEYYLPLENEKDELFILLEKDFTCLTDRGEDESENYPNPGMLM